MLSPQHNEDRFHGRRRSRGYAQTVSDQKQFSQPSPVAYVNVPDLNAAIGGGDSDAYVFATIAGDACHFSLVLVLHNISVATCSSSQGATSNDEAPLVKCPAKRKSGPSSSRRIAKIARPAPAAGKLGYCSHHHSLCANLMSVSVAVPDFRAGAPGTRRSGRHGEVHSDVCIVGDCTHG